MESEKQLRGAAASAICAEKIILPVCNIVA